MLADFDRIARTKHGKPIDEDDSEPFIFSGFPLPYSYVMERYHLLNRFGVLPRAGGIDDQDQRFIDSLFIAMRLESDAMKEYAGDSDSNGVGWDMPIPDAANL